MNSNKYYDANAAIQVIGCILEKPSLLEDSTNYFYTEDDFTTSFHRAVFGAIYNLYQMGTQNINSLTIDNYLQNRPESRAIYKAGGGAKWIAEATLNAEVSNFDYYYNRLKKMTLLRGYSSIGLDMSFFYNPDELFDNVKKAQQEDNLDNMSLQEISDLVESKFDKVKMLYVDNSLGEANNIGDNIDILLEELKQTPELGTPLYGKYVNTITRGARLGKLYIRSAATGVGKTRTMIADACNIACNKIYKDGKWQDNGLRQPTLYISTELDLQEVQTMALAFLSEVNEEHILKSSYQFGEEQRVLEAARILKESPLYIEVVPDFSLTDITNTIKRNIRLNSVQYICFDYIHSSMKILEEISHRSGGIPLREDNILFLLAVHLKDICSEFGVFILTSTQLNGSWKNEPVPDQNMLRGSKAIADKADFGAIMLDVTSEDVENLSALLRNNGLPKPNIKMSIYKNRRGSYNKCFLWMKVDKGTCRFDPIFCTDYDYNFIPINDTEIDVMKIEGQVK